MKLKQCISLALGIILLVSCSTMPVEEERIHPVITPPEYVEQEVVENPPVAVASNGVPTYYEGSYLFFDSVDTEDYETPTLEDIWEDYNLHDWVYFVTDIPILYDTPALALQYYMLNVKMIELNYLDEELALMFSSTIEWPDLTEEDDISSIAAKMDGMLTDSTEEVFQMLKDVIDPIDGIEHLDPVVTVINNENDTFKVIYNTISQQMFTEHVYYLFADIAAGDGGEYEAVFRIQEDTDVIELLQSFIDDLGGIKDVE